MTLDQIAQFPSQLAELARRLKKVEDRLTVYEETTDDEVKTAKALEITGIKSRDTLLKERDRPGTLLKYSKHGRSASYSRKSCIDYKLSRRLNQQAPMRISA